VNRTTSGGFRCIAAACFLAVGACAPLLACEAGAVDVEEDAKCPDGRLPEPLVGDIDAAIEAVEAWYGEPQEYFEISANLQQVSVIVASDEGTAEQAFLVAGEFVEPAAIGEAEVDSQTFTAEEVDFDPDTIFHDVSNHLDCPVLIDFAITGSTSGVLYDTTVASSEGGVLLVLLGPDGEVKAVQAS
jgi:hypothetical protein